MTDSFPGSTDGVTVLPGTPREMFDAIAAGQHHRPGAFRTAMLFDVDPQFFWALVAEARDLASAAPASQVGDRRHVTNWTKPYGDARQYSLKNRTGRFDDYRHDHDRRTDGKSFHHGDRYPTVKRWVDAFPGAINMRLNVMGHKSGLSPHEEPSVWLDRDGGVFFRVRFHLPLVTNPQAVVLLDGDLFHLPSGVISYFNNGCVHSASNDDPVNERLHLVWDMWLTEDTYGLMFRGGHPAPFLTWNPRANDPVGSVRVDRYEVQGDGSGIVSPSQYAAATPRFK